METIGPRWRMDTGMFVQGWFALGIMTISGIAYALPHFRDFQLALCSIMPIFVIYIWYPFSYLFFFGNYGHIIRLLTSNFTVK